MRSFFVQVCKRRCNRNNFDDAIFLFAWSHASHVFQIVILRVSVEVDIAVVSNVSFLFVFFLDKSFNKKKCFKHSTLLFLCILQMQSSTTRVLCSTTYGIGCERLLEEVLHVFFEILQLMKHRYLNLNILSKQVRFEEGVMTD